MGGLSIAKTFNRGRRGYFPRRPKVEPFKVNERITAPMVRLVGENITTGIYAVREAIIMARDQDLDLVEISPTASPPVCKVIDYKKFIYDRKKKQKEIKAKAQKVVVKEIRLGPHTDDHDFNFKLKHAEKFIEDGCKVKVDVFFKGRTIIYKDNGKIILLRFAQELEEIAKVEQLPKLEGKRMIMILSPKK